MTTPQSAVSSSSTRKGRGCRRETTERPAIRSAVPVILISLGAGLALTAGGGCGDGNTDRDPSLVAPQFLEFVPLPPDAIQSNTEPFIAELLPPFPHTFQHRFSMGQPGSVVAELTSFRVSGSNELGVSVLIELAEGNCDAVASCSVVAVRDLGQPPTPGTTVASLAAGTNTVRITISSDPEDSIGAVAFTGQVTHPQ